MPDLKWGQIIEGTVFLIMLYLIVVNWQGFSNVLRATGAVYTSSVRTLQGR